MPSSRFQSVQPRMNASQTVPLLGHALAHLIMWMSFLVAAATSMRCTTQTVMTCMPGMSRTTGRIPGTMKIGHRRSMANQALELSSVATKVLADLQKSATHSTLVGSKKSERKGPQRSKLPRRSGQLIPHQMRPFYDTSSPRATSPSA